MGALDLILIGGIAWVALLGLLVSMAAVASRADGQHNELVGVREPSKVGHSPRGLARRGRMPARSGVKLSA